MNLGFAKSQTSHPRAVGLALLVAATAGCATVGFREPQIEDVLVTTSTRTDPRDGIHADVSQEGTNVNLRLAHVCATVETKTVDRTTRRGRFNASPGADIAYGVLAAAAVGVGVGLTIDSTNVGSNEPNSLTFNEYGPWPERAAGIGLIGAGVAVGVIPIVDLVRTSGTAEGRQRVTEDARVLSEENACDDVFKKLPVYAAINGESVRVGVTDDDGRVTVDLVAAVPRSLSGKANRPSELQLSASNTTIGSVKLAPVWAMHEASLWQDVDQRVCEFATSSVACDPVKRYLETYPTSAQVEEAKTLLERAAPKLTAAEDEESWAAADPSGCAKPTDENGCIRVEKYLHDRPAGAHAAEAQKMLRASRSAIAAFQRKREAEERRENAEAERLAAQMRAKHEQECKPWISRYNEYGSCANYCRWKNAGNRGALDLGYRLCEDDCLKCVL